MTEMVEISDCDSDKYKQIIPNLYLPQLNDLESDGVNIQCVNSSEFVVGKQTNFNGPVTIINCPTAEGNPKDPEKEKIVIRDKVLSKSAEKVMLEMAGKNEKAQDLIQKKPDNKKKKEVIAWLFKNNLRGPLIIFLGLVIGLAVTLLVLYVKPDTTQDVYQQPQQFVSSPTRHHFIYSKEEWGGRPPTSAVLMKLPVPYVIVSHSVTTECDSLETCSGLLQNMQIYHLSQDYADVAYNFLVDSAGNVYEGRGWNHRNVHGGFENGRNLDICFIGDFSKNAKPTSKQFKGVELLIQMGVKNRKVSRSYSLISANATYATLSPGQNVYEVIKNWPHFDPDPASHVKEYDE